MEAHSRRGESGWVTTDDIKPAGGRLSCKDGHRSSVVRAGSGESRVHARHAKSAKAETDRDERWSHDARAALRCRECGYVSEGIAEAIASTFTRREHWRVLLASLCSASEVSARGTPPAALRLICASPPVLLWPTRWQKRDRP